ncbi:MAG: hypothetical protein ACYC7D_01165 [Nitrososphaerales archaeon]
MRNSSYAFIAAFLVLGWFETEAYTAQNICVTSCLDLSGMTMWEQLLAAAILPILIVLYGLNMRRNENLARKQKPDPSPEKTD